MIILCADDYAMTEGISRAIGELAAARRLSATSVMVTSPHWPAAAARLLIHRPRLAIGLHLNLTLGRPVGSMPRLAPGGTFPDIRGLATRALLGFDGPEVRAEIERQLDRFEQAPGLCARSYRRAPARPRPAGSAGPLLEAVARRYRARADPRSGDRARAIWPGGLPLKALPVWALALGFAAPPSVTACRSTTALPASPIST
jgi:hypothetical protein